MNAVMENLLGRRSVRAFKADALPMDLLQEIARAGTYAPSGQGRQTWKFTIVANQGKIQQLARAVATELGRENYNMYQPAALIVPSNLADSIWGKEDNACALENMFLAAHSFGIGSVWINQLQGICGRPAIRAILNEWGIPKDHVVYGLAALGYAQDGTRKEVVKSGKIHIIQ